MAQFDSLIILPLIWALLFILFFHYAISIEILIPQFFGAKKFRKKKLSTLTFYNNFKYNNKVKLNSSYSI